MSVAGIGGRDLVVNGICYVLIKIFAYNLEKSEFAPHKISLVTCLCGKLL